MSPSSQNIMPLLEAKLEEQPIDVVRPVFALEDVLTFINFGAQAIAQDEFSKCFEPKPRWRWSFAKSTGIPVFSFTVRYAILFPYRLCKLILATLVLLLMLPVVRWSDDKDLQKWLFSFYCRSVLSACSLRVHSHNDKPSLSDSDPEKHVPHIFVANHSSFIDYIVLSSYQIPHAVIAQQFGGIYGWLQRNVLILNGSVFFDRSQKGERATVAHRLKTHVHTPGSSPLLIFPEGTCVNNEFVLLFQKGAFEVGDAAICPVAIKYDKRYSDPYWNRQTQTFVTHILYLMTRWRLDVDVWYMTPQKRLPQETSIEFAARVKKLIAERARLKNLGWDGMLKNYSISNEKKQLLRQDPQHRFATILLNRMKKSYSYLPTNPSIPRLRRHSLSAISNKNAPLHSHWMTDMEAVSQNELLKKLTHSSQDDSLINAIADTQQDVLDTWRAYTKLRGAKVAERRIENSSWRIWGKQRVELEREKARQERIAKSQASISSRGSSLSLRISSFTDLTGIVGSSLSNLHSPAWSISTLSWTSFAFSSLPTSGASSKTPSLYDANEVSENEDDTDSDYSEGDDDEHLQIFAKNGKGIIYENLKVPLDTGLVHG